MKLTEWIPFINLYPEWAQITIFICGAIIVSILIFAPRKEPPEQESKVSVKHTIEKKFEITISLTEFKEYNDNLCYATFNIMNTGDLPFTIQDFFITVSHEETGTKSVHRALQENGVKLKAIVINPGNSEVVMPFFDISKAIFAVPDKAGQTLNLYSDIVVEAIALDGLRENLIFKNLSIQTEIIQRNENYFHKLLYVAAPYRTTAIRFLGNHAKKK